METTYNYTGQEDLLKDSFDSPVVYAGFWLRFAAYLIDAIVMYVVFFIVLMASGNSAVDWMSSGSTISSTYLLILGFLYVGVIFYFVLMESSSWQATLGKRAVGIKVTDMDGNRIGFGKALGRLFAKIISAVILYIGFFMAGFTEKKQGLHDIIAGTLVVKS